ncbi:hypothetical protein MAP00_000811 [Monascus purpureus]|nr:hypothetical protein MAP00_000811 [Monascus purpureus]
MFGNWFKSSNQQESAQQPTWDPNTLTMQQPTSPQAPSTENVVTEQPRSQESMQLRGGGGCCETCCGVCAGLACFECFEDCC